jgi:hypothetical protein
MPLASRAAAERKDGAEVGPMVRASLLQPTTGCSRSAPIATRR